MDPHHEAAPESGADVAAPDISLRCTGSGTAWRTESTEAAALQLGHSSPRAPAARNPALMPHRRTARCWRPACQSQSNGGALDKSAPRPEVHRSPHQPPYRSLGRTGAQSLSPSQPDAVRHPAVSARACGARAIMVVPGREDSSAVHLGSRYHRCLSVVVGYYEIRQRGLLPHQTEEFRSSRVESVALGEALN